MTRKGSWNMNIDFNKAYSELQERATDKNESINARVKYNILLIALRNGCRNHEAIEAYNRFIASGKPEFTVRTEKRKNKQYMRPAVIPPEIDRSLPLYTKSDENRGIDMVKQVCRNCGHEVGYYPLYGRDYLYEWKERNQTTGEYMVGHSLSCPVITCACTAPEPKEDE